MCAGAACAWQHDVRGGGGHWNACDVVGVQVDSQIHGTALPVVLHRSPVGGDLPFLRVTVAQRHHPTVTFIEYASVLVQVGVNDASVSWCKCGAVHVALSDAFCKC